MTGYLPKEVLEGLKAAQKKAERKRSRRSCVDSPRAQPPTRSDCGQSVDRSAVIVYIQTESGFFRL